MRDNILYQKVCAYAGTVPAEAGEDSGRQQELEEVKEKKSYEIIPVDAVPPSMKEGSPLYGNAIQDFLKSEEPVAKVSFNLKRKPGTIAASMKHIIRKIGAASAVKCFLRSEEIYLVNLKKAR